ERAGQVLLVRSKAGVRPTPAGDRLLAHARQILALSDSAWRDLHDVPFEGEVHLGITDYFRPADLTRLLARLGQHYPRLRLRTLIGKSDALEAAHRRGELDLAIVLRTGPTGDAQVLRTEAMHWVTAPGSGLPDEGRPIPLALLPETCSLHRLAIDRLQAHGIAHVVTHVASGVAGLQAAVAAGLGVGCLNASALIEGRVVALHKDGLPTLPKASFILLATHGGEQLDALGETVIASLRD
ncbi:MAG TPA: LysR substrate-binding domain-containing protein, partial [Pseudomonas sp.]|uniref:LysR substrate-binding domain-containing protein n=1 Tax=Pseudomonas sp. TaxID=306 RepID=UPI002B498DD4